MSKKSHIMLFPLLLVFYEISIYLSMDAIMPALPTITHVLGTTVQLTQLTATVWMLGGFLFQPLFSPLSDRYGRRPILLWGGVLYVFASLFCALAHTIHLLLLARLLQGIAMPSMYIAGYAAINESFETKKAVQILATMNAVTFLAPAFGPTLGAIFLMIISWRWIFILLGLLAAACIILLYFKMPETNTHAKESMKIGTIGQQYFRVLSNVRFVVSACTAFLPTVGMISWMLAGPYIVTQVFHHSTLTFGLIQTAIFSCFIIATKIISKKADEKRFPFFIHLGLGLAFFGGLIGVICAVLFPHILSLLILSIMIVTFGAGLSLPILSRLTLETSREPMGVRVTIFSIIRIGSGLLVSISLALFYDHSLLSIAAIIAVFTSIAVILRLIDNKTTLTQS